MYFLKFLEKARDRSGIASDGVEVEYRLACSGELYNRKVLTADHRKGDITRVLLRSPIELFVASQPFSDYPQELCARMKIGQITEREKDIEGPMARG
jgi:hypothetical protein